MNHPFFASLALRLELREDRSCDTAWTDGTVFAYNPDYVGMLPPEKLEGLTAHTVMHPACGHHIRRNERDRKIWNRACDYAVNWILLDAGLTLPDGYLYNEAYREKSAEEIYRILRLGEDKASDKQEKKSRGNESGKAADPLGNSDAEGGASNGSEDGDEEEREDAEKSGTEEEGDGLPEAGDPGMAGEVRDFPEGEREVDGGETDWDVAVIQAALHARGTGKSSAAIDRFVQNRMEPVLPWEELLSRFVENAARSDYSWMSPNRRYLHRGLYLPSLKNEELPEIVVAVDTSGSIKAQEVDRFAAEISEITATRPSRLRLIYCDRAVRSREVYERGDLPSALTSKGGGGTDYRPAFEDVDRHCLDPACLIYLTDLECRLFPEEPAYPVLWIKTGDGGETPPFGEVVIM